HSRCADRPPLPRDRTPMRHPQPQPPQRRAVGLARVRGMHVMNPVRIPPRAVSAIDHHAPAARRNPLRPTPPERMEERLAEEIGIQRSWRAMKVNGGMCPKLVVDPMRDDVHFASASGEMPGQSK